MISFEKYKMLKENEEKQPDSTQQNKEWRKSFIKLEKGFVPPSKMAPIVEAFLKSGEIKLTNDISKPVTMPKKTLFLVGGPVRDFLLNKTIKDYDLATNATPEQIAHILSNSGFKMADDRSGKSGKPMDLGFKPEYAQRGDKKYWFIKGRDASQDGKAFVISAVVDGEEFEIATFRKDAKVVDGNASVDFVDNPIEDASRRDLTINSLYIELSKPDGENDKLYDPTGKGYHDVRNSVVRTVGKASDRFEEDKLRILRAIRFHCRFGGGLRMDKDIEASIPKFAHMDGVALERIKDEFVKGLLHPDVDVTKYITIYKRTGLLNKVFPGVNIDPVNSVPAEFSGKKDKPLALAWLLQHNDISKVEQVLSPSRSTNGESKQTGWTIEEKRTVLFLLKLKDFDPNKIHEFLRMRHGLLLTDQQIRDWVEMFKSGGKHSQPVWAKHMIAFSQYKPSAKWEDIVNAGKDNCSNCNGSGCPLCTGGKVKPEMRSSLIATLEKDNFTNHLSNY
jgi:tRNA nucleotidyltransferase/poly(A) polymerase